MADGYSWACVRHEVTACYESHGDNYNAAGRDIGVNPGTISAIINGNQKDSPIVRERLNMPKPKWYKLAVTFATAAERDAFRRDCLNGRSFSEWVYTRWKETR